MSILEILLIGIGLAMDASAVSASNGMAYKNITPRLTLYIALTFGLFQGVMPIIGYYAGSIFSEQFASVDHWIALALLSVIGIKMLYDALSGKEDEAEGSNKLTIKMLLFQGVATSIDALAVGVSFAAMRTNIFIAAAIIACTTFTLSAVGVILGKNFGDKLNKKAEIIGGSILIIIGIKIFIEHMFM